MMQFKRAARLVLGVALAACCGAATASGFALQSQNGSGLGNAYAGATAGAEDASTIYFNPAGMVHLHGSQLVVAGNLISGSSQFTDTGSVAAAGRALGSASEASRKLALIPSVYFAKEINPRLRFGIGINAPFGSKTEYPADWIGRYQAIKSSVESVNVNPSLSWQVNDALALGAGLDYQHFKASLSNSIILAPAIDGLATMEGSDTAWGYNLGALLRLADGARIGVSYRSAIQYKLAGTLVTGANLNIPVTADLKTPDTWAVGYFKPLNNKWDVMADVSLTGWSNFNELRVVDANGTTRSLTPENWHDTWRAALGVNYHYSERWMLRAGMAYDMDPVPEALRTPRIPDSDRTWLSLGGQYKLGKGSALDFGYAHLFIKGTSITRNTGGVNVASTALYARVNGNYDSRADILSAQYTYGF